MRAGSDWSSQEAPSEGDPASANAPAACNGVYVPTEDIYSFMVLYPEIHRVRYGHYLNFKVLVACGVFCINLVMQVSITSIVSGRIIEQSVEFRKSLLDAKMQSVQGPLVQESLAVKEAAQEALLRPGAKEKECCRGRCLESKLDCCPPEERPAALAPVSLVRARLQRQRLLVPEKGSPGPARVEAVTLSDMSASDDDMADATPTSLCRLRNSSALDCSQPSFAFLNKWSDLDWDGDGVWTAHEAAEDKANLACQFRWRGLQPRDVFRSACTTVVRHFEDLARAGVIANEDLGTLVPPEVKDHRSLPHAYFEIWRGAVVLCASTEMARCGQMVRSGIFNGALPRGEKAAIRGIDRLDKALDLCQRWLIRGGLCEKALPVTYAMYKERVAEKCGDRVLTLGPHTSYRSPVDKRDRIWFTDVTFTAVEKYDQARSFKFTFFLTLIMFIWMARCSKEVHVIVRFADFVFNYPVTTEGDPLPLRKALSGDLRFLKELPQENTSEVEERIVRRLSFRAEPDYVVIPSISSPHKATCMLILGVRIFILFYMFLSGTLYLLDQSDYTELLVGAVELAFVFELPDLFYILLVGHTEKDEIQMAAPMAFPSAIPQSGILSLTASSYLWGLMICPAAACVIVWWNDRTYTRPILEALKCLCTQSGPRCLVARYQTGAWWDVHWPAVAKLEGSHAH